VIYCDTISNLYPGISARQARHFPWPASLLSTWSLIPKRKTIKAEILRRAQLAEEKVRNKLKVCLRQIALYLFTCFEQGVASKYPLHLMHGPLSQGIHISLLQPTTLMLHQSILWTGS